MTCIEFQGNFGLAGSARSRDQGFAGLVYAVAAALSGGAMSPVAGLWPIGRGKRVSGLAGRPEGIGLERSSQKSPAGCLPSYRAPGCSRLGWRLHRLEQIAGRAERADA